MTDPDSATFSGPRLIFRRLVSVATSENGRDFLTMLADRAIRMVVGVVMAGLTARYLGAEVYGWLNYAGAVAAFGVAVAQLGFDGIAVRELVKQPAQAAVIMGTVLVYRWVTGLVLALGLAASAGWLGEGESVQTALIRIFALSALAPALGVPLFWFQAQTRSRIAVFWNLVACVASAVLRWWLIAAKAPVEALAWASLLEMAAGGLLTGWAMFSKGGRVHFTHSFAMGRKILAESWPLLVGALAATVYMKTDLIMLKWLADDAAVGLYSAASRLSEIAYAIPYLAGASYMAKLTAEAVHPRNFSRVIERYFRVSAGWGYLLAIAGIILAPWLLKVIFGEAFAAAGTIARIHLVTVLFVCVSVARGRVLIINGWTKFAMCTALGGGALNVVLNLVFIPLWGAEGAAAATVLSHALAAVGSTLLYAPARELGRAQVRALCRPSWGLNG